MKRAEAVLQQTRSHLAALDETGLDPNAFAQVEISKREHLQARERLSRAQAELEQAQKELARLRRSAERVDRVFLLKAVTRAEWEAAREDLDKAETHHASARTRVAEEEAALQAPERLLERAREALAFARRALADELEARRMAIVQAEGQVEAARAGLAETSIRAPRDGIVSWLPRRVGEVVDQNDVILSLMDPDEVWIEAYVSGEELSQLRDGLPAKIHFTFTVFDGDTATEDEPDFGDLFLSLGIPGTSSILELPLSLAGFGDQRLDTATNTLDLRDVVTTGLALAAFLSETQGTIRFFILDADEGGNRLTFTDAPEDDFFLSVTLDQRIPEPATLALLAMGIFLAAWHRRRKIAARS